MKKSQRGAPKLKPSHLWIGNAATVNFRALGWSAVRGFAVRYGFGFVIGTASLPDSWALSSRTT